MCDFCDTYGMRINNSKTELMVINGDEVDKAPIRIGNVVVKSCVKYVYLGCVFVESGKFLSVMEEHVSDKNKHFYKFINFVRNNREAPFSVKKKVFNACLRSTLIYGCESWFSTNFSDLNSLYMSAIKCMLHVRQTTANDLCLLEMGLPSLKALVRERQVKFFRRMIEERMNMADDPLSFAMSLARENNLPSWKYIDKLLEDDNTIDSDINERKRNVLQSDGSKFKTYCVLNPNLSVHPVYAAVNIPEYKRDSFTRLMTSSHKLRIETGRWARLPREERTCPCDGISVQDEKHVIESCELFNDLRDRYPNVVFEVPVFFEADPRDLVAISHELLSD